MHGSVLTTSSCSRGLIPDFTDAKSEGEQYGEAIFYSCPGTGHGKSIHASFTGTIRREPNIFTMVAVRYVYVLRIASMRNLEVKFDPNGFCTGPPPSDRSLHIQSAPPNVFSAPAIPR